MKLPTVEIIMNGVRKTATVLSVENEIRALPPVNGWGVHERTGRQTITLRLDG
jgi:hypothetical protein